MKINVIESSITELQSFSSDNWESILRAACEMMQMGCEPRSALKQSASDAGMSYGDEMAKFVEWAESLNWE